MLNPAFSAASSGYYRVIPPSIEDRSAWEKAQNHPRLELLYKNLAKELPTIPAEPPRPLATDYLAAKRSNDRERLDRYWRNQRPMLSHLALNRCFRGIEPSDPDDRLLNWIWAFLNEPTWAVSAHLPGNDLPALDKPRLDLAATEMAAELAEIRECLLPWMNSVSETLANSIIVEIDRRVLTPFVNAPPESWADPNRAHVSNWAGVCAGSILTCCESLAAQGHPRPEARALAITNLQRFLKLGFTEHGECDEGVGYWHYGVGFACMGWSRLTREEFERTFDMERLREVADYPRRAHLYDDVFFSGNDGGMRSRAHLDFAPWLAAATGSHWLSDWARDWPFDDQPARSFGLILRQLAIPLRDEPSTPSDDQSNTAHNGAQLLPDQQVAIFRTPTRRGELLAALTGGSNAERHNHNDLGHFIVALNNELIVPDLGAPVYKSDFFGPKRYTYLAASSRGHCCPIIGDFEQRASSEAAGKILSFEPLATVPHLVLDLTAAYPPEAGLLSWMRRLDCVRREGSARSMMVFIDEFHTAAPNARITHFIWSLKQPQHIAAANQPPRLKLGPVVCEFSKLPEVIELDGINPRDHLLYSFGDALLHRISAQYQTDAEGRLKIETRFVVE